MLIDTSSTRLMERSEVPSTSSLMILARFSVVSLFIIKLYHKQAYLSSKSRGGMRGGAKKAGAR